MYKHIHTKKTYDTTASNHPQRATNTPHNNHHSQQSKKQKSVLISPEILKTFPEIFKIFTRTSKNDYRNYLIKLLKIRNNTNNSNRKRTSCIFQKFAATFQKFPAFFQKLPVIFENFTYYTKILMCLFVCVFVRVVVYVCLGVCLCMYVFVSTCFCVFLFMFMCLCVCLYAAYHSKPHPTLLNLHTPFHTFLAKKKNFRAPSVQNNPLPRPTPFLDLLPSKMTIVLKE